MNKLFIILISALLLTGCHSTIDLRAALVDVEKTAVQNTKPKLQPLYWFDTKHTCAIKLEQANTEIIMINNKLHIVSKQIANLRRSIEPRIYKLFRERHK